jgi:serine/threonine protein kinase/formylglycine-generating enzyme required for sulfatase activity
MTDTPKDPPKRASDPPSLPQDLGQYRLIRHVGAGGMGDVYLAHDTTLDRPVAVKFLTSIQAVDDEREQVLLEARAAARLQHPNVVTIFHINEREGRPFIISEFIDGTGLDKIRMPVPYAEALALGIGLARGLAAAHRRGVLHRDIKPGNAIIAANGTVKLLDFGLAKIVDELTPQSWSTPPFEAPPTTPENALLPANEAASSEDRPFRTTEPAPNGGSASKDAPATAAKTPSNTGTKVPDIAKTPIATGADRSADPRWPDRAPDRSPERTITAPVPPPDVKISVSPVIDPAGGPPSSVVRGTPYYMAPEIWMGHKATRRSDVYSLGALLFELCTGAPPHKGTPGHALAHRVMTEDAPPLAAIAPLVDPRFALIVDRCLRRDPMERFASGDELREALEQLNPQTQRDSIPEGNPYRGLLPFEAEHRSLFFGRVNEIGTLLERLRTECFVLVAGDSGVGKSSLCRAGVLPLLADGALGGLRKWSGLEIIPGRSPLASLSAALAGLFNTTEAALAERLRAEPSAPARDLATQLGSTEGVILFIDQLEELVTVGDPIETALVGEVLGYLASDLPGVRLIATARSDFLARIASIQGLGDELPRVLYFLRPMSPEKIRDAIVGPARAKGVSFESDELVDKLVESTARTEGGLPLLQFALAELWQARPQSKPVITAEALSAIGGVSGALARHADNIIHALPHPQRAAARRMLIALVTPEGTRARRTEGELAGEDAAALATLKALVQGRLLVARETESGVAYEMAHEALLKGWDTLRRWIDEQAGSRAVKQRLEVATKEWERLGRTREALWSQLQLAEARELGREAVTEREEAFLLASKRALRRKRWVSRALAAAVPMMLGAIYLGVLFTRAREEERTRLAEEDKRRRSTEAQLAKAKTSLVLARAATAEARELRRAAAAEFQEPDRKKGEEILTKAREKAAEADAHYVEASALTEAARASDPSHVDVSPTLRAIRYDRARAADWDMNMPLRDELLRAIEALDKDLAHIDLPPTMSRIALATSPPGADVIIEEVFEAPRRKRGLAKPRSLGAAPINTAVEPGSYLLTLSLLGHAPTRYPIRVGVGERYEVHVELPTSGEGGVPPDFAFIPAGRFLFGSSGDPKLRSFLKTTPLQELKTGSYLIARRETTFGEWVAFLNDLKPDERAKRTPFAGESVYEGALKLTRLPKGVWELTFRPGSTVHKVSEGQQVHYKERAINTKQDWLRFPVSGVSSDDIEAYARWFSGKRRVPDARLCTEYEWERAARGADDREYPHGDALDPDDANFEETYGEGKKGPDQVGFHPKSTSLVGLDDMVGNIFEFTVSSIEPSGFVLRGGSYVYDSASNLSVNRNPLNTDYRDANVGFRLCASVPSP